MKYIIGRTKFEDIFHFLWAILEIQTTTKCAVSTQIKKHLSFTINNKLKIQPC